MEEYYIYVLPGSTRESPVYLVKLLKSGAMFCSKKSDWHYNGQLAVDLYKQEDDGFVRVSKKDAFKILVRWGRNDYQEHALDIYNIKVLGGQRGTGRPWSPRDWYAVKFNGLIYVYCYQTIQPYAHFNLHGPLRFIQFYEEIKSNDDVPQVVLDNIKKFIDEHKEELMEERKKYEKELTKILSRIPDFLHKFYE